jgi:glycine dehydrogenase
MLDTIGVNSMNELIDRTVPASIRMDHKLNIPAAESEAAYLAELKETSLKNKLNKNYIGQGYYDTHTPSVILRNLFEKPGMVYAVYSIPGRDKPGPTGELA